jgi:hypothetical protein
MISKRAIMTLNLLVLAVLLMAAGNIVLIHPRLPPWVASFTWQAVVKPVLTCPYLIPPDCVEPLPGL